MKKHNATLLPTLLVFAAVMVTGCTTPEGRSTADTDTIADALAVGMSPLAKKLRRETLDVLPSKPKGNHLFDIYDPQSHSAWARNWTRKLDFTGVAWDNTRTATLVSPRHVVMAGHYVRKPGETVIFHNRRGKRIVRILTAIKKLPNADIAVGLLESEAPVTFYRVLAPSDSHSKTLIGALGFVTDQKRQLYVHEIRSASIVAVAFNHSPSIHKAWRKFLIAGDSGNPSFLLVDDELLLLGTHSTGGAGAGPFYSSPEVIASLNATMSELGGGYQLSIAE